LPLGGPFRQATPRPPEICAHRSARDAPCQRLRPAWQRWPARTGPSPSPWQSWLSPWHPCAALPASRPWPWHWRGQPSLDPGSSLARTLRRRPSFGRGLCLPAWYCLLMEVEVHTCAVGFAQEATRSCRLRPRRSTDHGVFMEQRKRATRAPAFVGFMSARGDGVFGTLSKCRPRRWRGSQFGLEGSPAAPLSRQRWPASESVKPMRVWVTSPLFWSRAT